MGGRLAKLGAVVTGASSGIGREIALAFAREGAHVVLAYGHSEQAASQLATEITERGGRARHIQADLADNNDIERLVDAAMRELGRIEIWANIAGADILTGAGSALSDQQKLERLIAVDLRGTMMCCWCVAPIMREAGGGVILNMSWDLALTGMAGRNPEIFAAIKAGITGFSKCLALSFAPEVRVNDLAPGWIETAFARDVMRPQAYEAVVAATPLQRFGRASEVAAAAVYLASDDAAFITGQTFKINGGLLAAP